MSKKATPMICSHCGHTGLPKVTTPGHFLIELLLWCMAIFPGLIYSIWRISKRHKSCEACGSAGLLDPNSPMGRRLAKDLQSAN